MKDFKAAAVQFGPESLKIEDNLKRMVDFIEKASREGAQLVVFPELSDSGYIKWPTRRNELTHVETFLKVVNQIPGESTEVLGEAAKKYSVYVISGLAEADPNITGRLYNSCVLIDPEGRIVGVQRKLTTPMAEVFYFCKGNELNIYETELGKIGMLICYDNLYPEPARVLTLKGMEILAMAWNAAHPNPPTISPELEIPTGYLPRTIAETPIVRAMENVIFVISANRVGHDQFSGGRFLGNSVIAAPWGEPLAEAGLDEEKVITADIRLSLLPLTRSSRTILRDRRPELFGKIAEVI